ncbi:MAG: dihydroorotate dehydrogenase electron transfer subunit [Caldilinea sp. CFX5]|nr:dihydroorotate dehydrogenase electron transfer subunit [Caldilinea sp. CFX5]
MFTLPTAATITAVTQDNYRTKTFTLAVTLPATPGQFVMVWLPRFDEKPFSLVNANPVTLMVTAVGPFSRLLHEKQPGDKVWLRGPFGQGYRTTGGQRLALVGGGYGVAPLYWLARSQIEQAATIDVIIGARTAADLLYTDRFQTLTQSKIAVHQTTEDGSAGQQGRVTDVLQPLLAAGKLDGIYACGPHGMLTALERLGQQYKVPGQLSWEAYMRCGIGICGSCEHEGRVLCLDGPVLPTAA